MVLNGTFYRCKVPLADTLRIWKMSENDCITIITQKNPGASLQPEFNCAIRSI